ncbi:MAG: ATP-binding cassette domain-containing protein, partial [Kiritimatiellia bacterium]|nr:ATP-binding cassette domain-containing protein [Kiritimatiellia bacterium]
MIEEPMVVDAPVILTDGLIKTYHRRRVVDGVSITVKPGEVVGLLGPNGAGKTTTFYMIVGIIGPNRGRVFFNRRDVTRM